GGSPENRHAGGARWERISTTAPPVPTLLKAVISKETSSGRFRRPPARWEIVKRRSTAFQPDVIRAPSWLRPAGLFGCQALESLRAPASHELAPMLRVCALRRELSATVRLHCTGDSPEKRYEITCRVIRA